MKKLFTLLAATSFLVSVSSQAFACSNDGDYYIRVQGGALMQSKSKIGKKAKKELINQNENENKDSSNKALPSIKRSISPTFGLILGTDFSPNLGAELELSYGSRKINKNSEVTLGDIITKSNIEKQIALDDIALLFDNITDVKNIKDVNLDKTALTLINQKNIDIQKLKKAIEATPKNGDEIDYEKIRIGTGIQHKVSAISAMANLVYKHDLNDFAQLRASLGAGVTMAKVKTKLVDKLNGITISSENVGKPKKKILPTISLGAGAALAVNDSVSIVPMYKYNMVFGKVKGIDLSSHTLSVGLEFKL